MCFDFLCKFCVKYSSFYEEFARYCHQCTNVCVLITSFSRQTLLRIEFSRQIFENPQISNFMKILPVGTELLRVDGRIDTDRLTYLSKLIVAFRSFANSLETLKYGFFPSSQFKGWAMDWAMKEFGFNSRQERDISVFYTAFRRVLEFTQFSALCVMGNLSPGMKRPRRNSDNTPPCSCKIKNISSQTSTRNNFSYHGAKLSKETLLQLPLTLQFWSWCTLRPFIPQSVLRQTLRLLQS
jgi:hypothetical protein